ncbi:GDCCVxC domain-containing (seleno)protein [Hydrogenophaga sp.]|uniref:GDCCVxC domain-containing (seleno)protein n=1 Tax=Hydrogenophaga sp. TaxID=1904254 RepID=UPI002FCABB3C
MTEVVLTSVLTCPECGHAKTEVMPTDACQWFYECEKCQAVLRPKSGNCCVYCSYGTVPCPPVQERRQSSSGKASCLCSDQDAMR